MRHLRPQPGPLRFCRSLEQLALAGRRICFARRPVQILVWLGWVEDASGRGDAGSGVDVLLQVSVWPSVVACDAGRRRPCSPVLALLPGSPCSLSAAGPGPGVSAEKKWEGE